MIQVQTGTSSCYPLLHKYLSFSPRKMPNQHIFAQPLEFLIIFLDVSCSNRSHGAAQSWTISIYIQHLELAGNGKPIICKTFNPYCFRPEYARGIKNQMSWYLFWGHGDFLYCNIQFYWNIFNLNIWEKYGQFLEFHRIMESHTHKFSLRSLFKIIDENCASFSLAILNESQD